MIEIKVLNRICDEDIDGRYNVVHVRSNFNFRGHLCFAFEILGTNLYEWLKAGQFRLGVIKVFALQILQCLKLLKSLNIIHCDLKPENVLLVDPNIKQPAT